MPVTVGVYVSASGRLAVVAWATGVLEPGAVRYRLRFAEVVVQSTLAWIGTDRSPTFILNDCEIVPVALTLPVNVSVVDDASVEPAINTDPTAAAAITVKRSRTLPNTSPPVNHDHCTAEDGGCLDGWPTPGGLAPIVAVAAVAYATPKGEAVRS
jgi:hypothetical protein